MNGSMKGINGNPTPITGTGEVLIRVIANDGNVDVITMKAVYIPSSPYNLMPPQMLYTHLHKPDGILSGSSTTISNMFFNTMGNIVKNCAL